MSTWPHLLCTVLNGQVLQKVGGLCQPVLQHPRLQQLLGIEAPCWLGGQQALVVLQQLLGDVVCRSSGNGRWVDTGKQADDNQNISQSTQHQHESIAAASLSVFRRTERPALCCFATAPTRVAQILGALQWTPAVHLLHEAAQPPCIHRPCRAVLDGLQAEEHRTGHTAGLSSSMQGCNECSSTLKVMHARLTTGTCPTDLYGSLGLPAANMLT